jgi:hypothetical protein
MCTEEGHGSKRSVSSDGGGDGCVGGGGDYGFTLYYISKFLAFRYDAI